MSKEKEDIEAVAKPAPPKFDPRVDEYACDIFAALGYDKKNLPAKLVEIYAAVKLRKDRLAPGRLTAGEFAVVAYLADLFAKNEE
jgi:hypothetical protein